MFTKTHTVFRNLVLVTILLIYLVILAGGIVRSTGSGMGCPDWPKCFGQYVPPTDISQLPKDYKDRFKVGNHVIADFNVFKTWTEYVNRLLGVVVGISVFVTFLYSLRFVSTSKELVIISFLILILTGLQGWIGAKVVATNLSKYMITVHMLIAMVIMSLAIWLYSKTTIHTQTGGVNGNLFLWLSVLTLVQVLVGTQVRQEVDTVAVQNHEMHRELWIDQLGSFFMFHRIIAVLVVAINAWVGYKVIKIVGSKSFLSKIVIAIVAFMALEYAIGVVMAKFHIPAFAQPIHLLLATIVFGLQFYVWLVASQKHERSIGALNNELIEC